MYMYMYAYMCEYCMYIYGRVPFSTSVVVCIRMCVHVCINCKKTTFRFITTIVKNNYWEKRQLLSRKHFRWRCVIVYCTLMYLYVYMYMHAFMYIYAHYLNTFTCLIMLLLVGYLVPSPPVPQPLWAASSEWHRPRFSVSA